MFNKYRKIDEFNKSNKSGSVVFAIFFASIHPYLFMSNETPKTKRTFGSTFSPEQQNIQIRKIMKPGSTGENSSEISNADIFAAIKEMQASIMTLKNDVGEINKKLTERVEIAEKTIAQNAIQISFNKNEIQRMKISREIVINGVPQADNEDVRNIFKCICKELGFDETIPSVFIKRFMATKDIKQTSVLKKVNIQPIFVEFAFNAEKKFFMERYFKTANLNVSCLGFQSTNRIFINERLTKHDIVIKLKALELKKKEKLHSVFIKDGRVFVKQERSSLQIHIDDVTQLKNC